MIISPTKWRACEQQGRGGWLLAVATCWFVFFVLRHVYFLRELGQLHQHWLDLFFQSLLFDLVGDFWRIRSHGIHHHKKQNTTWGRSFLFFLNQPPNSCKSKIMPAFFWLPPGMWSINTIVESTWPGDTRSDSCGYGSHLLLPRGTLFWDFFVCRHKEIFDFFDWLVVFCHYWVYVYIYRY